MEGGEERRGGKGGNGRRGGEEGRERKRGEGKKGGKGNEGRGRREGNTITCTCKWPYFFLTHRRQGSFLQSLQRKNVNIAVLESERALMDDEFSYVNPEDANSQNCKGNVQHN